MILAFGLIAISLAIGALIVACLIAQWVKP